MNVHSQQSKDPSPQPVSLASSSAAAASAPPSTRRESDRGHQDRQNRDRVAPPATGPKYSAGPGPTRVQRPRRRGGLSRVEVSLTPAGRALLSRAPAAAQGRLSAALALIALFTNLFFFQRLSFAPASRFSGAAGLRGRCKSELAAGGSRRPARCLDARAFGPPPVRLSL